MSIRISRILVFKEERHPEGFGYQLVVVIILDDTIQVGDHFLVCYLVMMDREQLFR